MTVIKKIVNISNVGRFLDFKSHGHVSEFAKLTLIYGPNGAGKSTLTWIFRSLENNEKKYINQRLRTTAAATEKADMQILVLPDFDNKISSPKPGSLYYNDVAGWNGNTLPSVRVFDSTFVHSHIHSGEAVSKEQRENLYQFLFLDPKTQSLFKKLNSLENEIKVSRKNESDISREIESAVLLKLPKKQRVNAKYVGKDIFIEHMQNGIFCEKLKKYGVWDLSANYRQERAKSDKKIKEVEALKVKILDSSTQLIALHHGKVNEYLAKLGANFSIEKIEPSNFSSSNRPRIKFAIKVNDVHHNVFESNTFEPGRPSFNTVLSEADRRSLSFAFFVSHLERDPDIAKHVVVFDDPVSSYDSARRSATREILVSLADSVAQLIVLSHDETFLVNLMRDSRKGGADIKLIQLKKISNGNSTFEEWNADTTLYGDAVMNYFLLSEYYEHSTGDPQKVATAIRTVLEENYRFRFPRDFELTDWLGDFIKTVEESNGIGRLKSVHKNLKELRNVNNYASKFHHPKSPSLDYSELKAYVKRALDLLHG